MDKGKKGRIGILTGGGDVPGSTRPSAAVTAARPAARASTSSASAAAGPASWSCAATTERRQQRLLAAAHRGARRPLRLHGRHLPALLAHAARAPCRPKDVPEHLKDKYTAEKNDLTDEVLANLEFLGVDYLVPMGGDDTLSYGVELGRRGFPVVALPKTMDNDVPGTDYCMGFSTCVSRTIAAGPPGRRARRPRTSASSCSRSSAATPASRRCCRRSPAPPSAASSPSTSSTWSASPSCSWPTATRTPTRLSVCLVSEGAMPEGGEMVFEGGEKDQYGHAKLGGIGQRVSAKIKELAPRFNDGRKIDMISMNLGYLVRSGAPDAVDCIVPTVYGNLAVDLHPARRDRAHGRARATAGTGRCRSTRSSPPRRSSTWSAATTPSGTAPSTTASRGCR